MKYFAKGMTKGYASSPDIVAVTLSNITNNVNEPVLTSRAFVFHHR